MTETLTPSKPTLSLSRRGLLLVGAAAVANGLMFRTAFAGKAPKKAVGYRDSPKDGQQCSACRYFQPPHSCQQVKGEISPQGWCAKWQEKG